MVQGTLYTVALWFSGGNILVPITLHALYQFFSSFFVWALASGDLRARIFLEEQALLDELEVISAEAMKEARDDSGIRVYDSNAADEAAIKVDSR